MSDQDETPQDGPEVTPVPGWPTAAVDGTPEAAPNPADPAPPAEADPWAQSGDAAPPSADSGWPAADAEDAAEPAPSAAASPEPEAEPVDEAPPAPESGAEPAGDASPWPHTAAADPELPAEPEAQAAAEPEPEAEAEPEPEPEPAAPRAEPPAEPPAEERTVFMPASAMPGASANPSAPPSATPPGDWSAASASPPPPAPPPPAPPPPAPPPPAPAPQSASPGATSFQAVALGEGRRIQSGDVLNHIFEVRKFIARGGMGEVFEGINVNTDERVAIKVILPHLAADPAVQAMFRKEARTLTRLSHPSLVAYRVLAQEPQLGVLYIVTDFIDGSNMSDKLRELDPTPGQLTDLLRKLAGGLGAAHALGAVHRDISPDNVILEQGQFDKPRIIDFGIAKDLDASTGTIVGDGFAGKLNYVAPEQLGDFDRAVGPWTDVYSLALTVLAVAQKKDVDMGGSLVDAVDKRRAGPKLDAAPEALRPVLEKMLKPNPAERARSMDEVLALLLDTRGTAAAPPVSAPAKAEKAKKEKPVKPPKLSLDGAPAVAGSDAQSGGGGKRNLMIGGGVGAAVLLGLGIWAFSGGDPEPAPGASEAAQTTQSAAVPGDPLAAARAAVTAGLPGVPCSWLDLVNAANDGNRVGMEFRGVAGRPAEAQAQIGKLITDKGLQPGSIDFRDVSPITATECAPLEAFRQIRATNGEHITAAQRSFEMVKLGPEAGDDAGKIGAQAIIEVDTNGLTQDLALVGIEESGEMTLFLPDKAALASQESVRPGVYRLQLGTTHQGWSGILMLTGKGPFDAALLNGPAGSRSGDWSSRFMAAAKAKGWQAEMVWYRTVDALPNS